MPEEDQSLSGPGDAAGAGPSGPGAPLGGIVADVGVRVQEILDTAERVSGELRDEAHAAGVAYLQERKREADQIVEQRMAELDAISQSLTARAAGIEREATAFVAEVEQVRWRLARLAGEADPQPEAGAQPRVNGGSQATEPVQSGISQSAALRATQMAVAGANRSDIERMLRDQFGVDDPSELDRFLRSGAT